MIPKNQEAKKNRHDSKHKLATKELKQSANKSTNQRKHKQQTLVQP